MKSFVTGTAGVEVPSIPAGESWTMNWDAAGIPFTIYDARTLGVVAFIQDDATQVIHNAAYSKPLTLNGEYADLAIYESNTTNRDLCDREYMPSLGVANIGAVAADSYTASFLVNGEVVESIEVTDALGAGSLNTVDFAAVTLPEYTSTVSYTVVPTTGDLATTNNSSPATPFGKMSDEVVTSFFSDFEYTPTGEIERDLLSSNIPFPTIVINGAEVMSFPFGAYGGSQSALRVNFFGWNPANLNPVGDLVIGDKILIGDDYKMTFDYGFTTWQGSQDRMEVQISTDCGATFETLWDKAGSELATAPEQNTNSPWVPTPTQWRSEEINLAIYAGREVIVRYLFTSGWGDMLYLDNVSILGNASDLDELTDDESLEVFPNPANEQINLELNLNESESVKYQLINTLGQVALQGNLGTAQTYNKTLDVSTVQAGSYLLNVQIGDRQVVKRVQILH